MGISYGGFMIVLYLLAVVLGGIGLYYGAEWLIKGAGSFALKMGISPVVVGLTIVGYGTSTPELIVSLDAALNHQPDISLGNILGSNICNIGLIIGVSLMIKPMVFHRQLAAFDGIVMLAVAGILTIAVWTNGLGRLEGLGFLVMVFFYTYYTIQFEKKRGRESTSAMGKEITKKTSWIKDGLYIALSFFVLFVSARCFLYGAVGIARSMAISEAVIGLTLVAVGTSLPEFATSILAACRGKSDIAIGNIVGSNIYNILGILGIVGLVAPLNESNIHFSDFMAMLGFTLAFYVMLWRGKKAGRLTGALLFGVYLVYVIALYER